MSTEKFNKTDSALQRYCKSRGVLYNPSRSFEEICNDNGFEFDDLWRVFYDKYPVKNRTKFFAAFADLPGTY